MWDFFEQPWTLLAAAVLVLFGVLTFRSVWSEKRKWWQWLLPLGVTALALGLDFGVATDLEFRWTRVEVHRCGVVFVEPANVLARERGGRQRRPYLSLPHVSTPFACRA